jgi:hypothetical protein
VDECKEGYVLEVPERRWAKRGSLEFSNQTKRRHIERREQPQEVRVFFVQARHNEDPARSEMRNMQIMTTPTTPTTLKTSIHGLN